MKYLVNDICEFTPLFDIDYSKKVNIISSVFFKMWNSGYKNFSIYLNGIKKLSEYVKKHMSTWKIRLFIDESIYSDAEIMLSIKKNDNIQLVKFTCSDYLMEDKKHHCGLFPTMVRFFPGFDFEYNDAGHVLISDIDIVNMLDISNIYDILNDRSILNNYNYISCGKIVQSILKHKQNLFYNKHINPYILATEFIFINKFNKKIIYDFFEEVKLNPEKNYSVYYNNKDRTIPKNMSENKFIKYDKKSNKNFIYGIDEYFLNKVLIKNGIDDNIPYANCIKFDIFEFLHYKNLFLNIGEDNIKLKLIRILFDYILIENNFKKQLNKNIKENYKFLLDYVKTKKNNYIDIYYKIYEAMVYLKDNKLYKFIFTPELYNLLLNERYFGAYIINDICLYNTNYINKNVSVKIKFFDEEKIKKLKKLYNSNLPNHSEKLKNMFNN